MGERIRPNEQTRPAKRRGFIIRTLAAGGVAALGFVGITMVNACNRDGFKETGVVQLPGYKPDSKGDFSPNTGRAAAPLISRR